ncbi:uncharacterized protein LOC143297237 [Babylonia areolata]|uniref:uncharacterized protein LOC143297237 n=1 Tax=Babylonia areolata TaxID=304850 RepID=UPI003FCF4954
MAVSLSLQLPPLFRCVLRRPHRSPTKKNTSPNLQEKNHSANKATSTSTSSSNNTMMAWLAALVLLATSSTWQAEAAKSKTPKPLMWKPTMVNETVTAEATMDFLIKNYDDSGDLHGQLKIGLFGERVPMTVLNFVELCNGAKRPFGELKYSGSYCHRLIPDMHFQCGDITTGDGNGGVSIYGDTFSDENHDIGHSERGTVSMSNRGFNTNGSQFFIIFQEMRNLDGKHVAFGQIIDKASLDFLDKINLTPADDSFVPKRRIKLESCTATILKKPLIITRKANWKKDKFE